MYANISCRLKLRPCDFYDLFNFTSIYQPLQISSYKKIKNDVSKAALIYFYNTTVNLKILLGRKLKIKKNTFMLDSLFVEEGYMLFYITQYTA